MGKWLAQAQAMAAQTVPANDALPLAATPEQAAELRTLIELVLHDASHEWDWVYQNACADAEAALMSFRTLADELREQALWGQK